MSRVEKVNQLLRSELANIIVREIPLTNGLITISYVDCAPNLRSAKIGVLVLPDNLASSVLKKLRQHSSYFCKTLKKKLNLKYIPKFNWLIDNTEKNAAEIEEVLKKIKSHKY